MSRLANAGWVGLMAMAPAVIDLRSEDGGKIWDWVELVYVIIG